MRRCKAVDRADDFSIHSAIIWERKTEAKASGTWKIGGQVTESTKMKADIE